MASVATAGTLGFDGIWVGTEIATSEQTFRLVPHTNLISYTTIIIVENGGRLVGKLKGAAPGRSENVVAHGNTLSIGAGNTKLELALSADGHTLSENGMITGDIRGGRSGNRIWRIKISGMLHRGTAADIEKHKNDPTVTLHE
jgi:hypothetical protein